MHKIFLFAAFLQFVGLASAATTEEIAASKKAVQAIELASMSLSTAVRQGDMNDFRKYIIAPVTMQMDAIAKLPNDRRLKLVECTAAGNEFMNRAGDSMRLGELKPVGMLEKSSIAACKKIK